MGVRPDPPKVANVPLDHSRAERAEALSGSPTAPGAANWLRLLACSALWGSAFGAMEIALEGFPPLWVAALRTGIAAPILLALAHLSGQRLSAIGVARAWPPVVACGLIGTALPFFLLGWGQQYVSSAFAGVAMGSGPIWLIPLAWLFLPDEALTRARILGLLIGFAGLLVLMGPGAFSSSGSSLETAGRAACIGAAVCYSIASVITRRAPRVPPLAFTAGLCLVAALVLLPLALVVEGLPRGAAPRAILAVLYAAALPTAFAFVLRIQIIQTAGSLFMSLVSYAVPAFAVLYGIALLGEAPGPTLFVALALILSGVAISQGGSLLRRLRA